MTHQVSMPTAASPQATTAAATSRVDFQLRIGAHWPSFEQFRLAGGTGLTQSVQPGSVGRLTTKEGEFAILWWRDLDRLYGLARDVRRLSQGVVLLRQAAEVVMTSADKKLGIQMIRDLSLQYQLPTVNEATFPPLDMTVDDGEQELDLDSFVPPRPEWK